MEDRRVTYRAVGVDYDSPEDAESAVHRYLDANPEEFWPIKDVKIFICVWQREDPSMLGSIAVWSKVRMKEGRS